MKKEIAYLIALTLIMSCKTPEFKGEYVQCPWNCHHFLINPDSTFQLTLNPEIGSDHIVHGRWEVSGKRLNIKPNIQDDLIYDSINNYYCLLIDGILISPNLFRYETEESSFIIKRNKLLVVNPVSNKSFSNCYFIRLSSDTLTRLTEIQKSSKNCQKPLR